MANNMNATFAWLKYGFLGLFLAIAASFAGYQFHVVKPRQDCERKGGWWDADQRVCGTPIDISQFTGRPIPERARPVRR